MLVLGHFHSMPERVPCIVLQVQLPVFRTSSKTLIVTGNAVCGNTYLLLRYWQILQVHVPTQYPSMGYGVVQVGSFALVGLEINRDQGRRRRFCSAIHQSPTLCWPRKRAELGRACTALALF